MKPELYLGTGTGYKTGFGTETGSGTYPMELRPGPRPRHKTKLLHCDHIDHLVHKKVLVLVQS